jgi:hypothetical protein
MDAAQIFEAGRLVASHPVLEGRGQRHVEGGHRRQPAIRSASPSLFCRAVSQVQSIRLHKGVAGLASAGSIMPGPSRPGLA